MRIPAPIPALKRNARALALFALATVTLYFLLGRLDREVDWLTVEALPKAATDNPFYLRVRVASLPAASVLSADLHWASDRNTSKGFLAAGGAKPVGQEGGEVVFEIMVPPRTNLRFVNAILYLSPTGNWNHHTFAATTGFIPVEPSLDEPALSPVRLPVHQLEEGHARKPVMASALPRYATGFLWLTSAMLLWWRQNTPSAWLNETPSRRRRFALVLGLTLAGVWELAGMEHTLGDLFRDFARAEDIYYARAVFQRGVSSSLLAAAAITLGLSWLKRASRPLPLGFGLYLMIALVSLLSLHAVDQFLGSAWLGVTLLDALKLLCAITALVEFYRSKKQSAPPP